MGGSVADGSHLPRAGIGQEVLGGGYAGAGDRYLFRAGSFFRGTVRLCGRPCQESAGTGEVGGRDPAAMGWTDVRELGSAHHRSPGTTGTHAFAAGAEAGRGSERSATSRR